MNLFESMKTDFFDTMLRAKKGYSRVLDPIAKEWELTRNEMDILLFLHNNPGHDRASDIVYRRGIAKSHVSLSVSTLEQKGLLLRRADENDRRTVHLTLTEPAVETAKRGREAQMAFFQKIFAGLTQNEVNQWVTIMEKVTHNIRGLD